MLKDLKPSRAGRAFAGGLLGRLAPGSAEAYIRSTYHTIRWQWEGRERLDAIIEAKEPVIYCFWHGRILMMCPLVEESPIPVGVMISNNRDGELISRVVQRFNASTIRGSSRDLRKNRDKGGAKAGMEALDHLKAGGSLGITPDGPRGPRMRAQQGAAVLSALAGVRTVPLAYSTNRGRLLKSWDRFLLPAPFTRGAYVVGEPIPAPDAKDDETVEAHRLRIEAALNEVTIRADTMAGREAPLPEEELGR